jgi:hypothetical protein
MTRHVLVLLLAAVPAPAFAEAPPRGGANDFSLNLLLVGGDTYSFDGGASARNDGGLGIGATVAHNLNNHFAIGADLTFTRFDYRAGVAPGAGNAGARFETSGSMDAIALRLHGTWNLLAGRTTPFLTAGAGAVLLDTNLKGDPPADACWVYPWYGQVCGAAAPSTTLTRLTYGGGVGVRHDLAGQHGFVRALAGGEWIHFSEASSDVGYWQLRVDFGLRF